MTQLSAQIVPVTPFQQNCCILFDADDKVGVVIDPGGDADQAQLHAHLLTRSLSRAKWLGSPPTLPPLPPVVLT